MLQEEQQDHLYLEAILRTMRQPLIVLSGALSVERANRAFYAAFDVDEAETEGRKIYDLGNGQWDIPELKRLLEDILPNSGEVTDYRVEHEFEQIGRRVMLLNAYRMKGDDRDDSILLSFEDFTERERAREELEGQKELAEKIVDASRDPLLILTSDLRVEAANETFYETFKVDPAETKGRKVYDLGNGQWDIPELRDLLESVLPDNDAFNDFRVEHEFEEIGWRTMVLNARRVDHLQLILLAIEDRTDARRTDARLRNVLNGMDEAFGLMDHDFRIITQNEAALRLDGRSLEDIRDRTHWEVYPGSEDTELGRLYKHALAEQTPVSLEHRYEWPGGKINWLEMRAYPVSEGLAVFWRDISVRKAAEEARRESEERQAFLLQLSDRLGAAEDAEAVISVASRMLGERLAASRVVFAEIDEGAGVANIRPGWAAQGEQPHPTVLKLRDFSGPLLDDLRAGKTVRYDDVGEPPYARSDLGALAAIGIRAGLSVPLVVAGRFLVNINVHQTQPRIWTDAEVALVEAVAERIWAAVQRARAEAALRDSQKQMAVELERTTLLRNLAERMVTEESLPAIHEEILSAAIAITGADAGTVQLYDPVTNSLLLLVARGFERNMTDHFHRVDADSRTACGIALRTGQRTLIDFDDDGTDAACLMHVDAGYHSAQATPLVSRTGVPIGMLNTHWQAARHRPSDSELRFLDLLARQAADLIEQRQAQKTLEQSEERFRDVTSAANIGIFDCDLRTGYCYWSKEMREIVGYPPDAEPPPAGSTPDFIHPEDRAGFDGMAERLLTAKGGNSLSYEHRIVRPTGEIRWVEMKGSIERSTGPSGPVPSRLRGTITDVTGRRRAEMAMRESEQRLRSAVEVGGLGLWDWDLRTGVVHWSDEHFRMEGYDVGEVTPSYEVWAARIHPEDREETEATLRRAQETGVEYEHEFRVVHPDGSVHWLSARGRFFYDESGSAVRMAGAIADMTERREMEERQRVLIGELQHRTMNLIGVVQSVADKTARTSADIADFRSRFRTRLEALTRAQRLLSRLEEHDRVSFDELLEAEFLTIGAILTA
ncbi:PAS domain S-box protein [Jiella marina]|uniref:PAS domain S-box protein n=1 Tax=Jiella sp. LLJ827 TaxID=2917712 RepID=UPI002101C12F|nr:PAS domain S-box protein [Jiella sp. LLJ827]MCQ0989068.1 PAS domain S-box protein [Jiella sp. LLJ827]